ncbi:phage tail tape measure protein, partial [Pseudomonas sp. PE-S1G-1]|uniref:phage tail tape measure protein n=1 Tax=Pseudomonas sp. PE-S1G-1 TaxID=1986995 RepID=UPI000B3FA4FD
MAESKYSLKLAAVDAYSSTFGDFSKKAGALQEGLKAQQAELQQLNRTARSVDGYAKLAEKVEGTKTALQAARVEQARLGREYQGATAKVAQLTQAHATAAATHKQLASSTEATTAQVRIARTEEARLARELKSATGEVAKLDNAQDKATAGVRTLAAAQRGQRNELKRLQADLTAAGVDTGKLASEQKRLEAATSSANAALTAQRARLAAVQGAQGRIDDNKGKRADLRGRMVETAALAYVASRPINQAMELETAMADVGKVLNFEGNGRQEMASANLKMASDRLIASSGMTAVDLAKIEYAAGQSGIGNDVKDKDGNVDAAGKQAAIMDFTRDAAIMGSAFDVDAQTAGETMAGWRASMALNRAQTLDLADSTNYLGNNFNATAADIASVVKRYGAVGKASGLTPEQTAALSAAFLNPGTEKEIAGTGFKNFTAALTKGEAATKGQRTVWKKLGFDPEDLAQQMQGNAPETIMTVLNAIKAEPVEEQAAIATQLFGSESIGAIQPLLQNLGEVERAFDMVKDKTKYATSALGDNGSMMQEAAGVANTSRTGWNAFTAKLTRLSTVIGQAMLPALNFVLVPLGALADGISWLAETFPNVTGALAVAAGGVAALTLGALGLKYAGLMIGQVFNRGGLARAKLDARTGQTAIAADLAVARLNATLGRLGAGGGRGGSGGAGGAGGAGGSGKGAAAGKGAAVNAAAKGGRLARLAEWGSKFGGKYGGKLLGTALTAATVASVASDALAAPAGAAAASANTGKAAEAIKASAAPAAAVAAKLPVGVVP